MSYDDENEQIDCELFGLRFKSTHAEQRSLWLRLTKTPESREWGITRNLVQVIDAPIPQPCHRELAERMEDADTAMTKLTYRLIDEMIAARRS